MIMDKDSYFSLHRKDIFNERKNLLFKNFNGRD